MYMLKHDDTNDQKGHSLGVACVLFLGGGMMKKMKNNICSNPTLRAAGCMIFDVHALG